VVTPASERENARLKRNARQLYADGHRDEAIGIVEAGLAKDVDPDWRVIARNWHQQAAASVASARVQAEEKQAAAKAATQYQQAVQAQAAAGELNKAGNTVAAVKKLWETEGLFVRAGQQAEIASQAPASAPSAEAADAELRRLIREFQMAWNQHDADHVRRVFPAFAGDKSPRFDNFILQVEDLHPKIDGTHALVRATVRHVPRPNAAKGRVFHTTETNFRFEQRDGHWIMLGNQLVQPPQGR
jgi:hypothetical protein